MPRGRKPGFKIVKKGAETPLSLNDHEVTDPVVAAPVVKLSAADLENPNKLTGSALRKLAHNRGLSLTALEGMADEKIRMELRYITNRQYEEMA